jgi:hypothetical protein
MGRGKCTFRQRDLIAALKAARAANLQVVRYEIGADGKIIIVIVDTGAAEPVSVPPAQIIL